MGRLAAERARRRACLGSERRRRRGRLWRRRPWRVGWRCARQCRRWRLGQRCRVDVAGGVGRAGEGTSAHRDGQGWPRERPIRAAQRLPRRGSGAAPGGRRPSGGRGDGAHAMDLAPSAGRDGAAPRGGGAGSVRRGRRRGGALLPRLARHRPVRRRLGPRRPRRALLDPARLAPHAHRLLPRSQGAPRREAPRAADRRHAHAALQKYGDGLTPALRLVTGQTRGRHPRELPSRAARVPCAASARDRLES
mmetsp:Transcript_9007/g.29445  ORF Transcript_9007/g.29445 Transcript_9007/m.29445 type:complete len:250 (-) Transcript_9007:239-988(-)